MSFTTKTIGEWCHDINTWAHGKGFWEHGHDRAIIVEKLFLVDTEVAEAYECLRDNPNPLAYYVDSSSKPQGFPSEIADCVIRLFDLAAELGMNLEELIDEKMKYNQTRPWKHGRHESST